MNVKDEPLTLKDALELYENGKHRRYTLLFSVNGGAFAIAKLINSTQSEVVLGGLKISYLAVGMAVFTFIMALDIYKFGERSKLDNSIESKEVKSKNSIENEQDKPQDLPEIFGVWGQRVLICLTVLIIIGWLLVGFLPLENFLTPCKK